MRFMCILNNIDKRTTNTVNSNTTYFDYKMADTTTSESLCMFKLGQWAEYFSAYAPSKGVTQTG